MAISSSSVTLCDYLSNEARQALLDFALGSTAKWTRNFRNLKALGGEINKSPILPLVGAVEGAAAAAAAAQYAIGACLSNVRGLVSVATIGATMANEIAGSLGRETEGTTPDQHIPGGEPGGGYEGPDNGSISGPAPPAPPPLP